MLRLGLLGINRTMYVQAERPLGPISLAGVVALGLQGYWIL